MGPLVLPLAGLLTNLFTNLWGAHKQSSTAKDAAAAQLEATKYATDAQIKAAQEALDYQKSMDARDYKDYLAREARDRTDWEASEQRKAPYRALGDSAVRTLADYIRVPGMQPAQEVPVQRWTASPSSTDGAIIGNNPGTSNTMPVSSGGATQGASSSATRQNPSGASVQSMYDAFVSGYQPGVPTTGQASKDFANAFGQYVASQGSPYQVQLHREWRPDAYDGLQVVDQNGNLIQDVDYIANAGGANPSFAWQPDTGAGGGGGGDSSATTESLLSKFGKRTAVLPWG